MEKRLYRSRSDRMIGGVCGGLGKYLGVDPVWIRLLFVLLLFASGSGFWIYLILWIIMPEAGRAASTTGETVQANVQDIADRAREFGESIQRGLQGGRSDSDTAATSGPVIVGLAFILLGAFLLLGQLNLFWWWRWDLMWPTLIIFIGVVLLVSRLKE